PAMLPVATRTPRSVVDDLVDQGAVEESLEFVLLVVADQPFEELHDVVPLGFVERVGVKEVLGIQPLVRQPEPVLNVQLVLHAEVEQIMQAESIGLDDRATDAQVIDQFRAPRELDDLAGPRKVIEFARSSELVDNLRIGCTIIKANAFGLHDLLDFCMENELYIKYRLGLPHKRLYTENLLDPYALNEAERYNVVEFLEGLICHYEQNEFQRFFYRSLIDQIVHNAPRRAGCDWQHRGATITSKGELLYCAVQSKVLGKIQEDDSAAAYFGNAPHLEDIISTKCDTCVHD